MAVDLRHWIELEGRLSADDAVGWALRLTKTLGQLHRRGLAHGRICPEAVQTDGAACSQAAVLLAASRVGPQPAFHSAERPAGAPPTPADDVCAVRVPLYLALTA